MTLKEQVLGALKWIVATRLLIQVTSWAITLVVMRLLTPADYGLLAMATVFTALMMLFAEGGIGIAVIQARTVSDEMMRQALTLAALVNTTLFGVLYFAAPFIADFFGEARLTTIIRVLASQFLIMTFTLVPGVVLGREMRVKAAAVVDFIGGMSGSLITLGLALHGYGVWSLVSGVLAAAVIRSLGMNLVAPRLVLPALSLRGAGSLLRYGGHVMISRVISFVYSQSDTFIGGKVLGKEPLGVYAVAMQLASLPVQKISSMVGSLTILAFARVQDEPSRRAWYLMSCLRALFLIAVPVCWGISAVADEIVPVFLGDKWLEAMLPLKLLALAMPLRLLGTFVNSASFGSGQAGRVTVSVSILGGVMLPAYLVGVQWGVIGLTIAWVIAFPLALGLMLAIALPPMGVSLRQVVRGLTPVLWCGSGMYATVTGLRMLMQHESALLRMPLLVAAGAAVFALLAWGLHRDGILEMRAMLRSKANQQGTTDQG